MSDERIFQDLIVLAHGVWREPHVGRNRREIDLLAVGQPCNLEKTAEIADRPSQSFGLYLFAQVGADISPQILLILIGIQNRGQAASIQSIEKTVRWKLRSDERVKAAYTGASRKEIGTSPPELSRAAPGEHESERLVPLDQEVDFVQ